jgi:hypothetical protein
VSGSTGWAAGAGRRGVGERVEQPFGDARRDERVAGRGGVDGLAEQARSGVLEQEPAGAAFSAA